MRILMRVSPPLHAYVVKILAEKFRQKRQKGRWLVGGSVRSMYLQSNLKQLALEEYQDLG